MKVLKTALAATAATVLFAGSALAQGKPAEIKVGITTFLSGPASVFGVPAKAAAEMQKCLIQPLKVHLSP